MGGCQPATYGIGDEVDGHDPALGSLAVRAHLKKPAQLLVDLCKEQLAPTAAQS